MKAMKKMGKIKAPKSMKPMMPMKGMDEEFGKPGRMKQKGKGRKK